MSDCVVSLFFRSMKFLPRIKNTICAEMDLRKGVEIYEL